jgi:glycosyltransferase involved in cell wall biosynthesis
MILSIVIPALKFTKSLEALLHSCWNQKLSRDDFEIVIISPDIRGFPETFRHSKNLILREIVSKNVSAARNLGVEISQGKYVLLLDDDVLLRDLCHLALLLEKTLLGLPTSSFAGGGYLDTPSGGSVAMVSNKIANLWIRAGLVGAPLPGNFQEANFLLGGNLFATKILFQEVPFAEEITWGGEDSVFSLAARTKGRTLLYSDQLSVIHQTEPSWKKFFRRSWLSGQASIQWCVPSLSLGAKIKFLSRSEYFPKSHLLPPLVLHFLILEFSKAYYKIRAGSQSNNTAPFR